MDTSAMKALWKAWLDAKTLDKAKKVVSRMADKIRLPLDALAIEPHQNGGFVASFTTSHSFENWAEYIVDVIAVGQRIGYSWTITGDILSSNVEGWCTKPVVLGITAAQWFGGYERWDRQQDQQPTAGPS